MVCRRSEQPRPSCGILIRYVVRSRGDTQGGLGFRFTAVTLSLGGGVMANKKHIDLLMQGVKAWNDWRQNNQEVRPDLSKAELVRANIREVDFSKTDLSGANLSGANLMGANLSDAVLMKANLSEAKLQWAKLFWANLSEANLSRANLSDANLYAADLRMALLNLANLSGVELTGAILVGADLGEATLMRANLSETKLQRVNFFSANLMQANLMRANLKQAKLQRANLHMAFLSAANLNETDLSKANLQQVTMVQTDVTNANLDFCHVYGISVWDLKGTPKSQRNLVITPADAPSITVDDLEVAQFIYLLLKHEKLRNVINSVTQRGVLILGRFSGGGLEVLQAVAQKLREERYLPIIFDFDSRKTATTPRQ